MYKSPDFELFAFWRSSATYRVRVALNLKGITALEHIVNIDAGENRGDAFLKLNPMGAIPALIVPGSAALTQSLSILEYLEELQPLPPLLPTDVFARARVRSIAAMLAGDTHPLITRRIKKYLTDNSSFDEGSWQEWQTHWFMSGLQALEQRLAAEEETGLFCHGDTPTMADICLASIIAVMPIFNRDFPLAPIPNGSH